MQISALDVESIFDYALASNGTGIASQAIHLIVAAIQRSQSVDRALIDRLQVIRGALGVAIVNWGTKDIAPPGPVPINGYFASASNRLVVSLVSLAVFTGLSMVVMLWCLLGLMYCWIFGSPSPNSSRYPELNFAAKVIADHGHGGPSWLTGLGNTTNDNIKKRVGAKVLYVGSLPSDKGVDRVVMGTAPGLKALKSGQPYL
jgi:hypothetical protein